MQATETSKRANDRPKTRKQAAKNRLSKYGPWALVTGATSGIGKAIALQLAEAGLNLVIVARGEQRLKNLARDLTERFGIEVQALAADLSDAASLTKLKQTIDSMEIGLLINNAGVEESGSFLTQDRQKIRRLNDINMTAPAELAHLAAPGMVERGRGGIVFVGSALAYQGVPLFGTYAASKANLLVLGESLHHELKPLGIDVLTVSPGVTETPMAGRLDKEVDFSRVGLKKLSPQFVARITLRNLGRRASVVTGMQYKFFNFLTKWIMPRSTSAWVFGKLMNRAFKQKPAESLPVNAANAARPSAVQQ